MQLYQRKWKVVLGFVRDDERSNKPELCAGDGVVKRRYI